MSWSNNAIDPASGDSSPVMRLKSVVLPAPFWPMMRRRSPASTVRLTASVTRSPPTDCSNPDGTKVPHPVQFHGPNPLPGNTEFFKIHEKPVSHSFNPQAPQGERTFTNVLWGYARTLQTPTGLIVEDASIPGPTIV